MSKTTGTSDGTLVNRRGFLTHGAAAGVGAVGIAGTGMREAVAQNGNGKAGQASLD